jgi:hypothetical protein
MRHGSCPRKSTEVSTLMNQTMQIMVFHTAWNYCTSKNVTEE